MSWITCPRSRTKSTPSNVARLALGGSGLRFDPPAHMAASYCAGRREDEPRLRLQPAAGMYGSVLDLVPLLRWLMAGESVAAAMLTPQAAGPLDFDERWGLGLALQHVGLVHAGRVAWHTGRTFGHRAVLFVLPDRGLGVAVLANFREAGGVEDLAAFALQTALLERDGLDLPASVGDAESRPRAPFDHAALQAHVGRYANEFERRPPRHRARRPRLARRGSAAPP
ncbi:serine hydrolase [Nannocystis pusilla]|uniref:serine hydrolase n=1 Tax=Nannocystis pusilla TaxID=889268 RepID=UPI003DA54DB6